MRGGEGEREGLAGPRQGLARPCCLSRDREGREGSTRSEDWKMEEDKGAITKGQGEASLAALRVRIYHQFVPMPVPDSELGLPLKNN